MNQDIELHRIWFIFSSQGFHFSLELWVVLPPEEKIALDESDENTDDAKPDNAEPEDELDDDELDEVAKGVG